MAFVWLEQLTDGSTLSPESLIGSGGGCGSVRDLLSEGHVLVWVGRVPGLSWLSVAVADLYSDGMGRPGIDPEAAVRLLLAGFLLGIVHGPRTGGGPSLIA